MEAPDPLPSGTIQVQMDFAYDGGGLGKGGLASLYVEGNRVAEGRVEHTHPMIFSARFHGQCGRKDGRAHLPRL